MRQASTGIVNRFGLALSDFQCTEANLAQFPDFVAIHKVSRIHVVNGCRENLNFSACKSFEAVKNEIWKMGASWRNPR